MEICYKFPGDNKNLGPDKALKSFTSIFTSMKQNSLDIQ